MTDPIADMLTRIRNAQKNTHSDVSMPYSKLKLSLANILEKEGYISSVKEKKEFPKEIILGLKYSKNDRPVINELKRISKPGQRIYAPNDKLPRVLNNLGISIISTSKGLMTGREARRNKLGGEVLCQIW